MVVLLLVLLVLLLVVLVVLVLQVKGTVCRVCPRCCFPPLNSAEAAFLGAVCAFPLLLKNTPKNCLIWSGRHRGDFDHACDHRGSCECIWSTVK